MDRTWMYDAVNPYKYGLKDNFISGVAEFVEMAMACKVVKIEILHEIGREYEDRKI